MKPEEALKMVEDLGDLVPGKLYDEARACFTDLNAFYDARVQGEDVR